MEFSFTLDHDLSCNTCPMREINFSVMKQLHKGYLCRHPQKKGNRYVYPDQRDIAEGCPFMEGK